MQRSLLESVLEVARELGASNTIKQTLDVITSGITDVIGFRSAAVNVVTEDGADLEVVAVRGRAELIALLGTRRPLSNWQQLLNAAQPWGRLRYISHNADQSVFDGYPTWTPPPSAPAADAPGAVGDIWDPDDALFAPMYDERTGRLIGALSVDEPISGRRPSREQCTVLEMFAVQAARAIIDARAQDAAEDQWRSAEARWELAFEHNPSGTALVDARARIVRANEEFARMLGQPRDRLPGMSIQDIALPEDVQELQTQFDELVAGDRDSIDAEKQYHRADGRTAWARVSVGAVRDEAGRPSTIIAQLNDIDECKVAELRLEYQSCHDVLTDLPNRALLERELTRCLTSNIPVGVLYCNLDRFKTINDGLGHAAGDELLREIGHRWAAVIPEGWLLGRIGGDEFAVVAPGEADLPSLEKAASALTGALDEPVLARGQKFTVAVSVGITVSAPWHSHADEVLREADQAMLRAKRDGRGRVEVYDAAQDHPVTVDDLRLEEALRSAIRDRRDLEPFFQPVIELKTERVAGWETLVRWRHPVRGLLSPEAFLPLAEKTGLVVPLGWWMLDQGCAAAGRPPLSEGWVSVNVSGSQLGRGLLPGAVDRAVTETGLSPDRLRLEITETALVDASHRAIDEIRDVVARGVHIALDDFGTGYSSLTLLRDLPVDVVKIDRSFVAPAADHPRTAAIVRGVVEVCQELGIDTVAEGVETAAQLAMVRDLGCTHAQGYLLGRPTPQPSRGAPD